MKLADLKQVEYWKKCGKQRNLISLVASWVADLKILYELNQSGKKQPGTYYALNFGYGTNSNLSQPMHPF